MNQLVLVLDFGGKYKELIARTVRSLSVYAEIKPGHMKASDIKDFSPIGIIISCDPSKGDPSKVDPKLSDLGIPMLACESADKEELQEFLYNTCGATCDYKLDDYMDKQIKEIQETVGEEHVLLALSGGVDSSVCAGLLSIAIPGQLTCIFVDHGLMRLNEGDEIEKVFSDKVNFIRINAEERFLAKLRGVIDPEAKRKIIGEEFARVFEEESAKLQNIGRRAIRFLAQGTIYSDVIESGGVHGATIKSHHNVGGLPENLKFDGVIEPLSGLFKDEVRVLGRMLKLPAFLIDRQPFPGPGLGIRVIGEITKEKLDNLRKADAILREEIERADDRPSQYFAVMTDTYSVGVKGGVRTYDPVVAIRAVKTDDFMNCEYATLSHELLRETSRRITDEVDDVSRVVFDITSKPPGTVEWE